MVESGQNDDSHLDVSGRHHGSHLITHSNHTINSLTTDPDDIRIFIFYLHIEYQLFKMLKTC